MAVGAGVLVIDGVEYEVIRRGESSSEPATSRAKRPLTEAQARQDRLRRARLRAKLTQAQLAKRLGKSQAFVSKAESGKAQVGERYVRSVLEACQLPRSFGAARRRAKTLEELAPHEISGLDPETLQLVERGSKRDAELRAQYVWWANADLRW